jgi:hypothetical protein
LHLWLLRQPAFRTGEVDTGWLEREFSPGELAQLPDQHLEVAALAAALLADHRPAPITVPAPDGAPLEKPSAWRLAARQAALH